MMHAFSISLWIISSDVYIFITFLVYTHKHIIGSQNSFVEKIPAFEIKQAKLFCLTLPNILKHLYQKQAYLALTYNLTVKLENGKRELSRLFPKHLQKVSSSPTIFLKVS